MPTNDEILAHIHDAIAKCPPAIADDKPSMIRGLLYQFYDEASIDAVAKAIMHRAEKAARRTKRSVAETLPFVLESSIRIRLEELGKINSAITRKEERRHELMQSGALRRMAPALAAAAASVPTRTGLPRVIHGPPGDHQG